MNATVTLRYQLQWRRLRSIDVTELYFVLQSGVCLTAYSLNSWRYGLHSHCRGRTKFNLPCSAVASSDEKMLLSIQTTQFDDFTAPSVLTKTNYHQARSIPFIRRTSQSKSKIFFYITVTHHTFPQKAATSTSKPCADEILQWNADYKRAKCSSTVKL